MEQIYTAPDRATAQSQRQSAARPDRFAFWAVVLAVVAMFGGLLTADSGASGGGVGTGGTGGSGANNGTKSSGDNQRASIESRWSNYSKRNKRWARRTSECESGRNPNAIGGGGKYRGAFQFLRSTWRTSPKSPGGDPIDYTWRTQAVVAVELKKRDGRGHWPVCG